jgi:mono/diheme cytochrome c family protein
MKHVMGIVVAGLLLGVAVPAAQQTTPDPKLVEAGKKLYTSQKCVQCHMIAGAGGTLTKQYPLDGVGARLPAADIRRWLTHPAEMEAKLGKPLKLKMSMRKYALSEADLDALVAYMLTLKEKKQ